MKLKMIATLALVALIAVPAVAQERQKSKKKSDGVSSMVIDILKMLEPVGLTADQEAKITELAKSADVQAKSIRESAGITPAVIKARMEALKAARETGKTGKELMAAIDDASGLSTDQIAAFVKLRKAQAELEKKAISMLTEEQKAKLPKKPTRGNSEDKGKAKKKDAA
ncbi:hypothetical protein SH528x_000187 [Novipirellula sp. SH528]|uniref:hypothetical protein n=1 Tax=Novipirellula sp. SH528 TaxID=3454466 RepID=UPI003F9F1E9D